MLPSSGEDVLTVPAITSRGSKDFYGLGASQTAK